MARDSLADIGERLSSIHLAIAFRSRQRDLDAVAAGLVHPADEFALRLGRFVFDKEVGIVLVEFLLFFFFFLWHRRQTVGCCCAL